MIDVEGGEFQFVVWDWWYYFEKVCQVCYFLNEEEVCQYFVLENVCNVVFEVVNCLWGLIFYLVEDVQVFIDGVEVWEVCEVDGIYVGVFYGDFFVCLIKCGGVWMNSFCGQQNIDGENQ